MDWGKVGALFTVGCFVFAGLALLFQIKPLPWRRPTGNEVGTAPVQPRFSKIMATFIVLGFLVSGVVLWTAWHPATEVVHFRDTSIEHLRYVHGKHFVNEEVRVDGIHFDECTFDNVTLTYEGTDVVATTNSRFSNMRIKTNSGPVSVTVSMLKVLGFIKPGIPVMDSDGKPIESIPGSEQIH